jgi:archaellum component FlaG (FlaF/FlaG flagellin family)
MTISGTGFYGQPKITSTAAGTKVGVVRDTGKVLTIHVTTKKGIAGEHTFTVKLANGKSAKVNYKIVK